MIDRRMFMAMSAIAILVAPFVGEGQEVGRVYQIGLLTLGADPTRSGFWQKFLEAMRELNYVEGRNLIVRRAFAEGDDDRLPGLVADLVRAKGDVIVTTATLETMAAKRGTPQSPLL